MEDIENFIRYLFSKDFFTQNNSTKKRKELVESILDSVDKVYLRGLSDIDKKKIILSLKKPLMKTDLLVISLICNLKIIHSKDNLNNHKNLHYIINSEVKSNSLFLKNELEIIKLLKPLIQKFYDYKSDIQSYKAVNEFLSDPIKYNIKMCKDSNLRNRIVEKRKKNPYLDLIESLIFPNRLEIKKRFKLEKEENVVTWIYRTLELSENVIEYDTLMKRYNRFKTTKEKNQGHFVPKIKNI